MPVQILRLQPKRMKILRNPVLGVIAENKEAETYIPIDGPVWLFAQIFVYKRVQAQLLPRFAAATTTRRKVRIATHLPSIFNGVYRAKLAL